MNVFTFFLYSMLRWVLNLNFPTSHPGADLIWVLILFSVLFLVHQTLDFYLDPNSKVNIYTVGHCFVLQNVVAVHCNTATSRESLPVEMSYCSMEDTGERTFFLETLWHCLRSVVWAHEVLLIYDYRMQIESVYYLWNCDSFWRSCIGVISQQGQRSLVWCSTVVVKKNHRSKVWGQFFFFFFFFL